MSRNIATGIDVGTHSVKVAVLEVVKNGSRPKIVSLVAKPSNGLRKGNVIDVKNISKNIEIAVQEAERASKIAIKRAYVSVNGNTLSTVSSKGLVKASKADGEITEYDIKRVVHQSEINIPKISNKSIIHTFPIQFTIDKDIVIKNPNGMKGDKLEVDSSFVLYLTQYLNNLIKSVESNRIVVEDVVASPLASARAVLNKKQKEVGSLILDLGAATTSITVFEDDTPIYTTSFPIGSEYITNDIALCLKVSLDEAEELKCSYGLDSANTRKISQIVEARLNDILELINNHLKKISKAGLLPAGVILVGGGSKLYNLVETIKKDLEVPAEIGSYNFLKQGDVDIKWSCAIGLALLGLDDNPQATLGFETANRAKNFALKWLRSFIP